MVDHPEPPREAGSAQTAEAGATTQAELRGARRVLVVLYGTFAVAATARAGVQLATKFSQAPLAYLLSLFSGLVYIAATIGLVTNRRWSHPLAWVAVTVELVGVLVIGTLSLLDRAAFPHDTVWSRFGSGYLFIPVLLPLAGLWWLRRSAGTVVAQSASPAGPGPPR